MRLPDITRSGLAAISIGAFVYSALRLLRHKAAHALRDDGPIRVKGGSVTVENSLHDWALDDDDDSGANEHHSNRRSSTLQVRAYKSEADEQANTPVLNELARQVVIHVRQGPGSAPVYRLRVRNNGGLRIIDPQKQLTVRPGQPRILENLTAGHWIEWVVVKYKGDTVKRQFTSNQKPVVLIEPQ